MKDGEYIVDNFLRQLIEAAKEILNDDDGTV